MIGRTTYIGFFIDWLIESSAGMLVDVIVILSASFYIGTFLYINGMVTDMKIRVSSIDAESTLDQRHRLTPTEKWQIYQEEIQFHIAIIE